MSTPGAGPGQGQGPTPTVLLILDGWGIAPAGPGNAVSLARTPNLDRLTALPSRTTLACSGRDVGLPDGFMGNSEVGHMNIGAGRVVYQDLTRIDIAAENGELAGNPALCGLLQSIAAKGGRLHLMGLLSDGGVHSHIRHLRPLVEAARARNIPVLIHAFLDGRDTSPTSGAGYVADLEAILRDAGWGRIATLTGRYYAMDRDKRYERNALAWTALTGVTGGKGTLVEAGAGSLAEAVRAAYAAGETDEFITPRVVAQDGVPVGRVSDGDGVFFFNFRADRARQLTRAFIDPGFDGFDRDADGGRRPVLSGFVTMTGYDASFDVPVAFGKDNLAMTIGEVVSSMGLRQLRIAETEKYAHVTYFLNCGREEPFPGEERRMVASPRDVATYDLKPAMSAVEVTDLLLEEWRQGGYHLVVCNLANCDMVGHTGIIPAAIAAVETVDACVGRIAEAVLGAGGRLIVTADHGNAEELLDGAGNPQTAHTTNRVHCVVAEREAANPDGMRMLRLRGDGRLGDIAPTILELWGVDKPDLMTGTSLIVPDPEMREDGDTEAA
ncbi:2,3-bisphosphoglycerate-independent phosphoglycerate mutase [Nitratidesulfovibrio sp.]|uniref:2,3-bisphosphoglycerate-independent phosphoglycerate mutase n=1 Tax=Nitratidesulfovibrio sp. TaxID=2802297 RepID=UPI003341AFE0